MDIKEIARDIFNQAKKGVVNIISTNMDSWKFFTRFYYKIEDQTNVPINNKYPIICIQNYNQFLIQLKEYLDLAREFYKNDKTYFDLNDVEFDKKLFLDLIINASNYELIDFINYIQKRQEILKNQLNENEFLLGNYQDYKIYAKVSKNKSNIESPYRFDVIFKDEFQNEFLLPSILFGKTNDECFVYSIQNFNKKEKDGLAKKLDRFFRKVNKGVDMKDEISFLSPNAVVSFAIFVEYLKSQNIRKFLNNSFLPIRYNASKISGLKHCHNDEAKKEFCEKHNKNQYSITNKLIYMFFRYENHFNNSTVFHDNIKQQIQLKISNENYKFNDNLICSIAKTVENFCQESCEK